MSSEFIAFNCCSGLTYDLKLKPFFSILIHLYYNHFCFTGLSFDEIMNIFTLTLFNNFNDNLTTSFKMLYLSKTIENYSFFFFC